ncbi:MAG: hypothetical protein IPQ16_14920 [Geobacteraceae bacterium]|nr:hypothetical protein [Geobacteraceae bacterium]
MIEVIVVAAIIAILAGILAPMIFNQIDEAKKTRALADCKTISNAVMLFRKETRENGPITCRGLFFYVSRHSGFRQHPQTLPETGSSV